MTNQSTALYVVATPIGNLGDLSRRAIDTLRTVAWIAAEDTRHTQALLAHHGIDARLFAAHEHNEEAAATRVIERLAAGESVALVSDAGTPAISDPGARLVARVREAGHPVIPVPGACAAVAALSAAGLDAPRWLFYGFLPAKAGHRRSELEDLRERVAALGAAVVFYEAPHRIAETLAAFGEVFGDARQVVLAKELTKLFETFFRGSVAEAQAWLAEDSDRQKGEFVILLAPPPAGAAADAGLAEGERVLALLLAEGLPVKQAARLAAQISGAAKNALYERALALKAAARDADDAQ